MIFMLQAPVSGRQSGLESGGGLAPTSLFHSGVLLVDLSAFLFTSLSSSKFTGRLDDYAWSLMGDLNRVSVSAKRPLSKAGDILTVFVIEFTALIKYLSPPQGGRYELIKYPLKSTVALSGERPPSPHKVSLFHDWSDTVLVGIKRHFGDKIDISHRNTQANVTTVDNLELYVLPGGGGIMDGDVQIALTAAHDKAYGDGEAKVDKLTLRGERPRHTQKLWNLMVIIGFKLIQMKHCDDFESENLFSIQNLCTY